MANKSTKSRKATTSRNRRSKDLPPRKAGAAKGGSLQTYIAKVQGEKQGAYRGG